MTDWIGLLFEVVFFALGLYLYLFALGRIRLPARKQGPEAERFRQRNKGWMRILALAMMAIFGLNIVLHLKELL